MKKIILLFAIVLLSSCSASSDETSVTASCTSRCKFTKDLSSNQFFYFPNVPIDCVTKLPSAETLKKMQASQTSTIYFCGCD